MTLSKSDIDWLKSEFLPDLAEAVEHRLKDKLDKIYTLVDKFAGDVEDKRDTQELHAKDHSRISDRLHDLEKHAGISL